MEIVHTPSAARAAISAARASGRHIAFVPTMGALHRGHLSLLSLAASSVSPHPAFLVLSIFVNPAQFAPHEDLSSYPRTFDSDAAACRAAGVHLLFAPSPTDMYPPYTPHVTWVTPDAATPEAAARPAFFTGVATVVLKLVNVVQPHVVALGQKDGVQCVLMRRMVCDLNVDTCIVIGPTQRHEDGLALSSRNVYLNAEQRAAAPAVFKSLCAMKAAAGEAPPRRTEAPVTGDVDAEAAVQALAASRRVGVVNGLVAEGESDELKALREIGAAILRTAGEVQYIAFSDACTGAPIPHLGASTAAHGAVLLSVAVKVGSTRLIDNVILFGSEDDLGRHASEVVAGPTPS